MTCAAFVLHKTELARHCVLQITNENFSADNNVCKRIVLVGGGHVHLQVIKAFNKKARQDWHVTLVDRNEKASYSGMVPGCISGQYTKEETEISLSDLSSWADIKFYVDQVIDIDLDRQKILLENTKEWIEYDVLSFDIGSTSRGLKDVEGVSEFAIPTRPIDVLVDKIDAAANKLEASMDTDRTEVCVIGGGVAGIELALTIRQRFKDANPPKEIKVTILDSRDELLPQESSACREALKDVLSERDIEVLHNTRVSFIEENEIKLQDGRSISYTHCIWATGAEAHDLAYRLKSRGLSVSKDGWIITGPTLQSVSHKNIFAAGDCAMIEGIIDSEGKSKASPPKAGVYAVRAGPVLVENLACMLNNRNLTKYEPQDEFLRLINCGDGKALGFRFGLPLYGKWVYELKDTIDEMFMNLFRKEHLPDLDSVDSSTLDTTQYDQYTTQSTKCTPNEAKQLLIRTDDEVDYQEAWAILRQMMSDQEYRKEIISESKITIT